MDQQIDGLPSYIHIEQNDFLYRKHKRQKEEDIAICVCQYDANDPDSACGERCLNVLTSTECTPGFCPCDSYCKNQRFQKCEYSKTKLFKTEGRGWGLLADGNIKGLRQHMRHGDRGNSASAVAHFFTFFLLAGQFIIEYCGEVISWKEARRRSQAYEAEGLKDAFIISLNAYESIDATRKGSHARFINHSCQPNCETRKWTVLGEIRVGIFAKQDILSGTELSYDYNFEWYGGAKVRCLCGASCCSGFLGAKSRGFQTLEGDILDFCLFSCGRNYKNPCDYDDSGRHKETCKKEGEAHYVWEDDDDRYSVENIPLYDSAEDEPTSKLSKDIDSSKNVPCTEPDHDNVMELDNGLELVQCSHSEAIDVEPLNSIRMEDMVIDEVKLDTSENRNMFSQDTHKKLVHKNAVISRIQSNSACRNYHIDTSIVSRASVPHFSGGKTKNIAQKQVEAKVVGQLLASKEAREEVFAYEDMKNVASFQLNSLYDEIRPAIEEHERDSQDSVSTSVAEKWIEASCTKLKADFDFYSSIIKHVSVAPRRPREVPRHEGEDEEDMKYLEMGV